MTLTDMSTPARIFGNLRAWLVAGPARSVIVQWLYGWVELALGRIDLARRHPFRAADHFAKASRRVEIDTNARQRARVWLTHVLRADSNGGVLEDFLRTSSARSLRSRFLRQPFPLNVTLRGNLLPLKAYDPTSGEKGVLLLLYNQSFEAFNAVFRTRELSRFYSIVLEPSFHHFEDRAYTLFPNWQVIVQARNPVLMSGLVSLGMPFDAVPLNSGDWVDPEVFRPLAGGEKIYDLIYIANWSRNKRHELLFEILRRMPRVLRVALVGFTWERRRSDILADMNRYGVADRCEIFSGVPPAEVNRLLNAARVNLMISRFELANRALYEAMYADIPTIANRDCRGLDLACVNDQTGLLVSDRDLPEAIMHVLDLPKRFSPRAWAMEHTQYARSTHILNEKLKQLSLSKGEPWTADIAAKVNRPDPVYKFDQEGRRFEPVLHHLAQFLRSDNE